MRHPLPPQADPISGMNEQLLQTKTKKAQYQIIHDSTHVIRYGSAWGLTCVIGEYFKNGHL